ncbi:MAG: YiiX/YebB-like N1pC/P60 family cysteine hydrolase [Akkermansia sp.]
MLAIHRYLLQLIPLLLLVSCGDREPPPRTLDFSGVRAGDILFRLGDSLVSDGVLQVDTEGDYSHVGIAIEHQGRIMAAHAVPDEGDEEYTKLESLDDFYAPAKAKAGAIYRLPINEEERQAINDLALETIAKKVPFDHDYELYHHDKLYCTEFIWMLYQAIGWDISRGQRKKVNLGFIKTKLILPSQVHNHPQREKILSF